jgi:ribulose-phosphate 3-epimerase
MIEEPERHIEAFAQAGASILTVHPEAGPHVHRLVQMIKGLGVKAGVSLNPASPLALIEEVLADVDLVLLMTVNPGWGGQAFLHSVLPKIRRLRRMLDEQGLAAELEVDGGITAETAPLVVEAGARVLVAGTAVFRQAEGVAAAMVRIEESVRKVRPG